MIAPRDAVGVFVGLAVVAYTLPGVIGALALSPVLRHRPSRTLALGGPLVGAIGPANTLTASGVGTVLLAAGAALMWPRR